MKKFKNNKGLFDKRRFEEFEKEKKNWLKNLSIKKGLKIEEDLLSSKLLWKLRKNFIPDNPVCLKMLLCDKSHRYKEKIKK